MPYYPGQNIAGAGTSPYDFTSFGQYDNPAYDNSQFAHFGFRTETPFDAWAKVNIFGLGAAPPGMSYGAYYERMRDLSDRFSNYGVASAAGAGVSIFGAAAVMYNDLVYAARDVLRAVSGAGFRNVYAQNAAAARSLTAASKFTFGPGLMGGLMSAMYAPVQMFSDNLFTPFMKNVFGPAVTDMVNRVGNVFGYSNAGVGLGTMFDSGIDAIFNNSNFKTMRDFGAWIGKYGKIGAIAQGAIKIPGYLAATAASYYLAQQAIDTVSGGVINSIMGVTAEEDTIADIFEGLSKRVLSGPSEYRSKQFAKDIASAIRTKSFAEARPSGLMGYLGISDTAMGRFTGGWSAMDEMRRQTAHYALMADSGLLTKSNSAEEFIRKADAMYSAINKLGEALGQTTTKAIETARVLKSQGLSQPGDIAAAGALISASASMTGYSTNQVLALSGEASEAFRGTIYGSRLAFNLANSVIRKSAFGGSILGNDAYDRTLYNMRGADSMNVMNIRVMSDLYNSSEIKSMMIASMYNKTDTGYEFTGKINRQALNQIMSGGSNYLTDEGTLAILNQDFAGLDSSKRRMAERAISDFSANLTSSQLRGMLAAAGRMRGYTGPEGFRDMLETRYREMGVSPTDSYNLAKLMAEDTRTKEFYFEYYDKKERQLSNIIESNAGNFYRSRMSDIGFDTHAWLGKNTFIGELLGGMAAGAATGAYFGGATGAGIGAVVGAGAAVFSNTPYFEKVGRRMGLTNPYAATAAGAAGEILVPIALIKGTQMAAAYSAAQVGGGFLVGGGIAAGGLGLGYAGSKIGHKLYDQYFEGGNYDGFSGRAFSNLLGTTGVAAGLGAVLTVAGANVWNPVGAGVLAVAGLYSLYDAYAESYTTPDNQILQRKMLRDQINFITSAENIRGVSIEGFTALSKPRESSDALSIDYMAKYLSFRPSESQISSAKEVAAGLRAAYSKAGTAEAVLQSASVDYGYYFMGYSSKEEWEKTRERRWFGFSKEGAKEQIAKLLKPTRDSAGNYRVILTDRNLDIFNRFRTIAPYLGEEELSALKGIFGDLKGVRFEDAAGNLIANGDAILRGDLSEQYDMLSNILGETLKSANEALRKRIGGTVDAFSGKKAPLKAANAPYAAALITEYSRVDGPREDAINSIITNAVQSGAATKGEMLRLADMVKSMSEDDAGRALMTKIQGRISDAYVISTQMAYSSALKQFLKNKSGILGAHAGVISNYLEDIVEGRIDKTMDEIDALSSNGFASVADAATQQFLLQDKGIRSVADVIYKKLNAGYAVSADLVRREVSQTTMMDQDTKNIFLASLPKTGDIDKDKLSDILASSRKHLLTASLTGISQATAESVQSQQIDVLSKLGGAVDRLVNYLDKKDGVSAPPKEDDTLPVRLVPSIAANG